MGKAVRQLRLSRIKSTRETLSRRKKHVGFSLPRRFQSATLLKGRDEHRRNYETQFVFLAFRGKPVSRVDLFGSAARGEMTPESDVDILVTPTPEATRRDLFIWQRRWRTPWAGMLIFSSAPTLNRMKNHEARDLILKSAVPVYVA